jgi:hypothetical protein
MQYSWETKEADTTHQENEHKPNPNQFWGGGLANQSRDPATGLKQTVNRQYTYAVAECEFI